MEAALSILQKYWKHQAFREPQLEIIREVLEKRDVFAQLPTGMGKSICYQVPTLMQEGICLVISPLIALMEDQVRSLEQKGIRALALTSRLNRHETVVAFDNLRYGKFKFLYLSPEKLQSELILKKIAQLPICLIAVDEAHCISQWGHDFRPAYLKIASINEIHPHVPKIALTATATEKVSDDIIKYLELKQVRRFTKSFLRHNVRIRLIRAENVQERVYDILYRSKGSAIVYTRTRKVCMQLSDFLVHRKLRGSHYHGGLTNKEKSQSLERWMKELSPIMVATNAFGMGIDKPDVRTIIHAQIPFTLENYLQEIGRAGRDGKKSDAFLIYNDNEIYESIRYAELQMADPEFCGLVYTKLQDYYQIATGEQPDNIFDFDLGDFCVTYDLAIPKTFAALQHLEQEGILHFGRQTGRSSRIRIIDTGSRLYELQASNTLSGKVVQFLLRNYGGILDQLTPVHEGLIAAKLEMDKKALGTGLDRLQQDNVIIYKRSEGQNELLFLVPREDKFIRNSIAQNVSRRNKVRLEKTEAMISYVKNQKLCRNEFLLHYFGEESSGPCGNCDICLGNPQKSGRPGPKHLSGKIMELLSTSKPLDIREICNSLETDRESVIKTLEFLVEKKALALNLQNKFELIQ